MAYNPAPKPQLSENEEKGRFAAAYVRTVVETGWRAIIQEFQGVNDRGFDFVVHDVLHGVVTSTLFCIQVKGGQFDGNVFAARVDERHVRLWTESNVPVVLVCVDVRDPVRAYWRLIVEGDHLPILMDRQRVFGPQSRDDIVASLRHNSRRTPERVTGELLYPSLSSGIRSVARQFYVDDLSKTRQEHPMFGPIEFTRRGWRHITRRGRPRALIWHSLQLLPCVRKVIDARIVPSASRRFAPIARGDRELHRSILVFERWVDFRSRSPALVKVAIERDIEFPRQWAVMNPTTAPRRVVYRFLSVYEQRCSDER